MKVIKPLTLGTLFRTYRFRQENRLSVIALGFFTLGQSCERFLVENLQWARIVPVLPAGQPLDHVLPKMHSEAMLFGEAYAPGGHAVTAMKVRMQVGKIDKSLRVIGERAWRYTPWPLLCFDDPKPFVKMPIDYTRAFGGAGFAANPVGCAYLPRFGGLRVKHGPMPNVEYPQQAVSSNRRAYMPAAFAPLDIVHSPRLARCGSFDKKWLEQENAGFPDDFDWSLFNLSAADQQCDTHFAGGESYRLDGLHPTEACISGELPAMRVRGFVQREGHGCDEAEEFALAADTVLFFPSLGIGALVYRGETSVQHSLGLDIATLQLAYEHADALPRTLKHYRQVMALRSDAATATQHAFNESQLAPPRSEEAKAARSVARAQQAQSELAAQQALLDELDQEFWQDSGMQPPAGHQPPQATPSPLDQISAQEAADGDFDLSRLFAQADALAAQIRSEGEARMAAAEKDFPPPAVVDVAVLRAEVFARAALAVPDLDPQAAPVASAIEQALAQVQADGMDAAQLAQLAQARAAAATLPALQRAGRRAAQTPPDADKTLPRDVAEALGAQIMAWHRAGQCLAGRDFAGADLRGADLRGADLREVMLEGADLRSADFSDADLSGAALQGADLRAARFDRARLGKANLCHTQGERAHFVAADLRHAHASHAQWPHADLRQAQLDHLIAPHIGLADARLDGTSAANAVLLDAQAPRSRWSGCRWEATVALGANFEGADFSQANMLRSVLLDAQLGGSNWTGSQLERLSASGKADWTGANMSGMRAKMCGWRAAKMSAVDLRDAVFMQCDLGFCTLSEAQLSGGSFYRCLFMSADMRGCNGVNADFFQSLMRNADLRDADLAAANLVQVDHAEARFDGARLIGALRSPKVKLP